jgi:hypothetical protein
MKEFAAYAASVTIGMSLGLIGAGGSILPFEKDFRMVHAEHLLLHRLQANLPVKTSRR